MLLQLLLLQLLMASRPHCVYRVLRLNCNQDKAMMSSGAVVTWHAGFVLLQAEALAYAAKQICTVPAARHQSRKNCKTERSV